MVRSTKAHWCEDTLAPFLTHAIGEHFIKPIPQTTERLANDFHHVCAIADFIREKLVIVEPPSMLIICGSGLSLLAAEVTNARSLPYADIPGFPVGHVKGHCGTLVYGTLAKKTVLCMQGRVHVYECSSPSISAMPVRVAGVLGCRTLVLTAAVGGVDHSLAQGDILLVEDHIAPPMMTLRSPLVGPNDDRFGPRFISTVNLYDKSLRKIAVRTARELNIELSTGVYAMVGGPQFETPAEIRMLKNAGASVVGMSVSHEALVARHMGMRTLGMVFVSNMCEHGRDVDEQEGVHEEVLESGRRVARDMAKLVKHVVGNM